jgi:hypothetical protein
MNTVTSRTYRRLRSHARQLRGTAGPLPMSAAEGALLAPIGPADLSRAPGLNVVLIDDCRDQVNFGANVLVDGLIEILQRGLPNPAITPIPSHWLMDTSGGWEAFVDAGEGLRQPEATFPTLADQFDSIGDEWLAGGGRAGAQEFIGRLRGADLVALNGEGSIYRTNQSAIRELFLAWFAKNRLGIPTVFINGMIHLTDVVPVLPAMVRKSLSGLDAVAVREPWSLRNLQAYAPEINARMFPDSAFAFARDDARDTAAVRHIRERIGNKPYFCFDPGAMPLDHRVPKRSALYELISRLQEVAPQAVLINSSPSDGYIEQIASETGGIYVDSIVDYREYMAVVEAAQFVVTGRYHNPILAALVGTPSITLASANHKVHGTCEVLDGLCGVPYDGTHLRPDFDRIVADANRHVSNRAGVREALLTLCERRRAEAYDLGPFVADAWRAAAGSTVGPTSQWAGR